MLNRRATVGLALVGSLKGALDDTLTPSFTWLSVYLAAYHSLRDCDMVLSLPVASTGVNTNVAARSSFDLPALPAVRRGGRATDGCQLEYQYPG